MSDLRQTSEYSKYMKAIRWNVDKTGNVYSYSIKIPLLGFFIKVQRPEKIDNKLINTLVKKYKPFHVVVEPKDKKQEETAKKLGFGQMKTYYIPSKTIFLDLRKSEKQLLKEMHYKTRYNIKKLQHSQLTRSFSSNISAFADFWQECALKQRGMFLSQKKEIIEIYKAFGKNARIILIKKENELLSGILLIKAGNIAYYMHAASTNEGKSLFAPTMCAWEAIKLAKKLKCKLFDFEGIYDERFPIKTWLGFTRFKKSFGGTITEYPGTYQKFLVPFIS